MGGPYFTMYSFTGWPPSFPGGVIAISSNVDLRSTTVSCGFPGRTRWTKAALARTIIRVHFDCILNCLSQATWKHDKSYGFLISGSHFKYGHTAVSNEFKHIYCLPHKEVIPLHNTVTRNVSFLLMNAHNKYWHFLGLKDT